jgi:hypothetical protein
MNQTASEKDNKSNVYDAGSEYAIPYSGRCELAERRNNRGTTRARFAGPRLLRSFSRRTFRVTPNDVH